VQENLAKTPEQRCQNARDFGTAVAEAARISGITL